MSDLKTTIARVIEEHFDNPDQQKFLSLCSILDPRFKSLKFLRSPERKAVIAHLQSVTQEAADSAVAVVPSPKRQKTSDKETDILDFVESNGSEGTSSPHNPCSETEAELTQYLAEEQISRSSDTLKWWQLNEHRFKTLAVLARKYLAVPGTSVPSERLFSTAGFIVDKCRASLHPDTVDCLLFLNKNM